MIHYMTTSGVGDAWVANELRVVQREELPFVLHALRRPRSTYFVADDVRALAEATRVLYPLSLLGVGIACALAPARFGGRFWEALWNALVGPRESLPIRLRTLGHLAVACHWAATLRGERVSRIHSQWIHSAGSVAFYGAWLLGVPFSFTGHAADLFRERAALRDKIRRADWIACISSFHRDFYLSEGARLGQLERVYCGIDCRVFSARVAVPNAGRPGSSRKPDDRLRILAAGRLVEKKGFPTLIAACALLRDRGVSLECTIGGSGPLEAALRTCIGHADLGDCVRLTGCALKQEEIPDFMARGDVFCLPCKRASDGDIDGLPQLLMEAMACGLPVVSTRLVGIPDLVQDGESGLLVDPDRPEALADALESLARDPEFAERLASAGRDRVREHFDLERCLEPLLRRFRASLEAR